MRAERGRAAGSARPSLTPALRRATEQCHTTTLTWHLWPDTTPSLPSLCTVLYSHTSCSTHTLPYEDPVYYWIIHNRKTDSHMNELLSIGVSDVLHTVVRLPMTSIFTVKDVPGAGAGDACINSELLFCCCYCCSCCSEAAVTAAVAVPKLLLLLCCFCCSFAVLLLLQLLFCCYNCCSTGAVAVLLLLQFSFCS